MNPALQRYLDAASGLTTLTAGKAEQIAKQLVRSGEAAQDQVSELVEELLERQRHNREAVAQLVKSETSRAVRVMGLATNVEVEELQRQVAELTREVKRLEGRAPTKKASKQPARKTVKKTAKQAAKKAPSKKATTKKATTKKATTKKASAPTATPAAKKATDS